MNVSKTHENRKLGERSTSPTCSGQHAVTGYTQVPLTAAVYPQTTSNPIGVDWKAMETNWDYVGVSNSSKRLVSSTYGLPNLFQTGRQIRLKLAFTF